MVGQDRPGKGRPGACRGLAQGGPVTVREGPSCRAGGPASFQRHAGVRSSFRRQTGVSCCSCPHCGFTPPPRRRPHPPLGPRRPPSHTGRASSCLQASQGPCHLPDTTPPLLQVFAQVSPLRRIRTSHPTPSSSPFLALEGCVALATVHQTIQLLNVTARCWARCRLSARSAVCPARAGRPVGSFVMRCLITICGMKK